MKKDVINEVLDKLDFNQKSDDSTLFFTKIDDSKHNLFFEERLILDIAKKLKATAVYFRRFPENQSSKPQLFLFDNTQNSFSKEELAELHKKIWSSGIVPIYYVFDNTSIDIFDARKHVDYNEDSRIISAKPFESLSIVKGSYEQYQKYSAKLFANGTFWEQKEFENQFLSKDSSENKLIDGLKKVRAHFISESGLNAKLANQLLVLSILVKYLEERKDEHGNHVFPSNYFVKYNKATCFCDVLRSQGLVVELFADLSTQFNGRVFELKTQDKQILIQKDLTELAKYLDANSYNNQLVLWPLYSFEYLPVELISRIYEEFADLRSDAVYTPIHLARLMVDECMPIAEPKQDFKVIDVSCGSGVFLVAVFKRLVQWWQKEQFEKTGKLIFPNIDDLKTILRNSIHGVDIQEASVRLSVFSLSIALCDMLTPTEIWTDLRFDDLREKNIHEENFFKYLNESKRGQFDLVIGNPPFEDKVKDFDKLIKEYNVECEYAIPRNQIAMLFLQQAMKLLKSNGLLCFVMPSGPLLYNNTLDFRKEFFSRYAVPQIIDLSNLSVKSLLFERTVSTCVVFAYNAIPKEEHSVLHVTVRRTKAVKEKLFFEIDYYDMYSVPQYIAESDSLIWKANLLGGNALYYLTKRIRGIRTVDVFLKNKRKTAGWKYGEGYQIATKSHLAEHLTDKLTVSTPKFTENGIIETQIEKETHFQWSREPNKEIFLAPHLLIKKTPGVKRFAAQFVDFDLIFKHEIIGIHAPKEQEKDLIKLEKLLQSNYQLLKMLLLSFSSRAGISRSSSTVLMKDILALPYPEDEKDLKLSYSEEIIKDDVLKYKLEELSKGEKAKINTRKVTEEQLSEFGDVFCNSLNPIYQNDNRVFKPLTPIKTLSYTCFPFAYGDDDFSPLISSKIKDGDLSELMENQQEAVLYRRVLRLYQKDIIYLIKPNTLRYWLKSVALRDASDVIVDFVKSGY